MKLVASLIVRNELGRYLEPCIRSLQGFCDEIAVLDDWSDDGTLEWLNKQTGVLVGETERPTFYEHEGRARQALLQMTMKLEPTHVLAIDADEFVTDGHRLRALCEEHPNTGSWSLIMEEVWKADERSLWTRQDGGWRQHPVGVLWKVPDKQFMRLPQWRIMDRALACGREPLAVRMISAAATGESILHFGWTNEAERDKRYQRYVTHDDGKFHASTHLRSIMWPDRKCRLRRRPWPQSLDQRRILERVAPELAA